jgi:hypothetical protein
VAIKRGEIENAKQFLLAAGQTSGSPVLNSFGPDIALAKELWDVGQKDAVTEYVRLCLKFWNIGQVVLDEWPTIMEQTGPVGWWSVIMSIAQ